MKLSGNSSQTRSIYFFSGTHWDREWYQTFQGFRYRLVEMMNGMIEGMEQDPEFLTFHLDGQTIVLEDYLEIEPQNRDRLKKLMDDGRLAIGPWYVMPDEFLLSGESLIRNLMMGHKICREWGQKAWKYGYICDIFGHIAQMPQIFNHFSIDFAVLGRGTNEHTCEAHFRWQSPDGSECITFKLPDSVGYGDFFNHIIHPFRELTGSAEEIEQTKRQMITEYMEREMKRSPIPVTLLMDALDHQVYHKETPELIQWLSKVFPDAEIKHLNLLEMGKELSAYRDMMPVKVGELNEPTKVKVDFNHLITHTLSSRYPLKKANDECQTLLEKWIDPMLVWGQFMGFSAQKTYVDLAYKYLIQNHPHDSICGCSIDRVHQDMEYRFAQTKEIGQQIFDNFLHSARQQYTLTDNEENRVLVLYNPLPFARREVVTLDVDFPLNYSHTYQEPFGYESKNSFKIVDRNGNERVYGISSILKNYKFRSHLYHTEMVNRYRLSLEVDVPAMGKAEYKIVPFTAASRYLSYLSQSELEAENELLKMTINSDGSIKLLDKLNNKLYDGLLSYLDDGEIGDGWYHTNPAEDMLVSSAGSACRIERIENGPVRAAFRITHQMKVPAHMDYYTHGIRRSQQEETLTIVSVIGLSKGASFIDIETTIANRAKDHRVRLKLPTSIDTPQYFVNQPFYFAERNTGILKHTEHWKECDVPEKQMGGIVGKRTDHGDGIAFISAFGLHECAALDDDRGTINITLFRSFQKTFLTNGEPGGQILGDLSFKYVVSVLQPETTYADLIRLQDGLQAGLLSFSCAVPANYQLTEPTSILHLEHSDICMSILKRPEDGEPFKMIVRVYNMSDRPAESILTSFYQMSEVIEVDFNEEIGRQVSFHENRLQVALDPWKIQTYSIKLRSCE